MFDLVDSRVGEVVGTSGLALASWSTGCDRLNTAPSCPAVDPKRAFGADGETVTTLGDVLYAERSPAVPTEDDWAQLVAAVAAGDQRALRALYERSHRLVFTLAMRICGNRATAEEVTLDVFHDVWRRAAQYSPDGGSVIGWIMMQTRSRALDRVRFEGRKKRVDTQHPADEAVASGPAETLDARERSSTLRAALEVLSPHERVAIETAFFSELTYAETAQQLDEPVGTVKTRVRSGLAKLRRALGADGEGGDM